MEPLIAEIKTNSLDDGPGIRTVVFFKGCPLSCIWCQNPETRNFKKEIVYNREECSYCGKCIGVCPQKAISPDNPFYIDRNLCTLCGKCEQRCQTGALHFIGRTYSCEQLAELILEDEVFFRNTHGGVTLSGGEPLAHLEYVSNLVRLLKSRSSLNICIETCGYFDFDSFEQKVLPFTDLIFFDLKLISQKEHLRFCRISNQLIKSNLIRLHKTAPEKLIPRIPLIPGITASDENLSGIRTFLDKENIHQLVLLPYNKLWETKPEQIGEECQYSHDWISHDEMDHIRSIFAEFDTKPDIL